MPPSMTLAIPNAVYTAKGLFKVPPVSTGATPGRLKPRVGKLRAMCDIPPAPVRLLLTAGSSKGEVPGTGRNTYRKTLI
jgi:hypothetical protein